jgi:hypothetical protein
MMADDDTNHPATNHPAQRNLSDSSEIGGGKSTEADRARALRPGGACPSGSRRVPGSVIRV